MPSASSSVFGFRFSVFGFRPSSAVNLRSNHIKARDQSHHIRHKQPRTLGLDNPQPFRARPCQPGSRSPARGRHHRHRRAVHRDEHRWLGGSVPQECTGSVSASHEPALLAHPDTTSTFKPLTSKFYPTKSTQYHFYCSSLGWTSWLWEVANSVRRRLCAVCGDGPTLFDLSGQSPPPLICLVSVLSTENPAKRQSCHRPHAPQFWTEASDRHAHSQSQSHQRL